MISTIASFLNVNKGNDKLSIAFQIESLDKGGMEQVVANLIRNIDSSRFVVTVFITGNTLGLIGQQLLKEGFRVKLLNHSRLKLKWFIARFRIELVNLHFSLFGLDIYKRNDIKSIYTIHNSYTWLDSNVVKQRALQYKNIDKFIAVSEQVKFYFTSKFNISSSLVEVIHNGFDDNEVRQMGKLSRKDLKLKEDDFVLINVATYTPIKNQNLIISAIKEIKKDFPKIKVLCFGNTMDKNYFDFLVKRVKEEKLEDNILLEEYRNRKDLFAALHFSNVFILPSIHEGFANTILEAMSFSLPLILSDCGSAGEVLKDKDFGILIPNAYKSITDLQVHEIVSISTNPKPKNLPYLVNAIKEMYNHSHKWKLMGQLGSKELTLKYMMRTTVNKYEQKFLELGGSK